MNTLNKVSTRDCVIYTEHDLELREDTDHQSLIVLGAVLEIKINVFKALDMSFKIKTKSDRLLVTFKGRRTKRYTRIFDRWVEELK